MKNCFRYFANRMRYFLTFVNILYQKLEGQMKSKNDIFNRMQKQQKQIQLDKKYVDKVELITLAQNNRSLHAAKSFKQFDTILQLEPLAISVLAEFKAKVCNYCLQEKQLVRWQIDYYISSSCKAFYYCSGDCQKADWKDHKLQCKSYTKMLLEKNITPLKQIHTQFCLNMRVYLKATNDKQFKDRFLTMVSLQNNQNPQKLQYFQQMSVVLMQNLGLQKNQQNMMALMSIANRISINTFTIQDPLYNYGGIAIGLFYPANFINHDCQPNCIQIFDGRNLKIMANKDIQQGQQISISYTNSLDSMEERKFSLRNNYLFECFCQLCQVQKMFDINVYYLLCPKCKHSNSLKRQANKQQEKENKEIYYICNSCNQVITTEQLKSLKQQVNIHSNNISKSQEYQIVKKYFFSLKKLLNFNDPLFGKLIRQVYYRAITTALSLESPDQQRKMFEQCYILLKQEMSKMKTWYRMDQSQELSLMFIWKYAEMGKLCYNLGKAQKAYQYTQKAITLANKINYKFQFKDLKQLEKRMDEMRIEMSIAKGKAFRA